MPIFPKALCIVAGGLALISTDCARCEREPIGSAPASTASELPTAVPEPGGVIAKLFISRPERAWNRARDLAGRAATLFPSTFPILVTTALELPHEVADSVDGSAPAVGALVSEDGSPRVILGLHVRSGPELVARLTTGREAKFRLKGTGPVAVLQRLEEPSASAAALAIIGNYLVVAPSEAVLAGAGAYVARTLPRQPMTEEAVVCVIEGAGLATFTRALELGWQARRASLQAADQRDRQMHSGRAPDFGDPRAALALVDSGLSELTAVLASSERLRVVADPGDTRLELRLELHPKAEGAAQQLLSDFSTGDGAAELLGLPSDSALAIQTRSTRVARAAAATRTGERIAGVLAGRLSKPETAVLTDTLAQLAAGRGDTLAVGLRTLPAPALIVATPVLDEAALGAGIDGFFRLLQFRPFAEPLEPLIGKIRVERDATSIAGFAGPARHFRLKLSGVAGPASAAAPHKVPARSIEFVWITREGKGYGVLAADAKALASELSAGSGPLSFAKQPEVLSGLARVGRNSGIVALIDPLRLGLVPGSEPLATPLLLSVGHTATVGWMRAEADAAALRTLIQSAADE